MKSDRHEVKGKLNFLERPNNVADLRCSMLTDECDSLKRQIAGGGVYSGGIVQQLENESKDVDALKNNLSLIAAHAQKED